jgi:hypothetical protein
MLKTIGARTFKNRYNDNITPEAVLDHVASVFSILPTQSSEDLDDFIYDLGSVEDPIPGIAYPVLSGHQCPMPGCRSALENSTTWRKHLRDMHQFISSNYPDPTDPMQYQKIFIAGQGATGFPCLLLKGDWECSLPKPTFSAGEQVRWTPATGPGSLPQHLAAIDEAMSKQLGWSAYMENYGGSWEMWKAHLTPPTKATIEALRKGGKNMATLKKIEEGLLWLTTTSNILVEFLTDADEYFGKYTDSLRAVLKARYGFFCDACIHVE